METRHARRLRRGLDAARIVHNDQIFGVADTGAMTSARVREYLENLPDGVSEIYFHPATVRPSVWPANYRCGDEAAALLDGEAAAIIARRDIEATSFAGLGHAA